MTNYEIESILDRVFINQSKEKDQLSHRVNKLSKAKRKSGILQFWAKLKIQQKVGEKAHSFEIRYSKVIARGTSIYTYDGSGVLERSCRKDIATFANEKIYHIA